MGNLPQREMPGVDMALASAVFIPIGT